MFPSDGLFLYKACQVSSLHPQETQLFSFVSSSDFLGFHQILALRFSMFQISLVVAVFFIRLFSNGFFLHCKTHIFVDHFD